MMRFSSDEYKSEGDRDISLVEPLIPKNDQSHSDEASLAGSTSDGSPLASSNIEQYYNDQEHLENAYRENPGLSDAFAHVENSGKFRREDADMIKKVASDAYTWLDHRKKYLGVVIPQKLERLHFQPLLTHRRYEISGGVKAERDQFVAVCKRILELRYKEHIIPEEVENRISRMEEEEKQR